MRKLLLAILFLAAPALAQVPVALSPVAHQQFFYPAGTPVAGGKLCTYNAGTTTQAATYVDSSGVILNSNPIVLDSGGYATIYLASQSYKFVLYDNTGNFSCPNSGGQIWAQDNVNAYQIISGVQNITFAGVTSDPTGVNGMVGFRSDLGCLRFFFSAWDCLITSTSTSTLTNKTINANQSTLTCTSNVSGQVLRNNGTSIVCSAILG